VLAQGVVLQGTPSKVVLLRNMVAPGEVDESLEDEIAEELSKFGQVVRVLIFEVTEPDFPAHQAVRSWGGARVGATARSEDTANAGPVVTLRRRVACVQLSACGVQVRIFVELDRVESATKAVISLQGRFFGGKTTSASFFSEDRFLRRDLAPLPEEM